MRSVQASEPVYYVETGNFALNDIKRYDSTETSIKLFKLFEKRIKKQCKMKIGRYYISESAKEMYIDREEAGNCFFFSV